MPPEPTARCAAAAQQHGVSAAALGACAAILEPPATTIEALVASIRAKRSAALMAGKRKTPAQRKEWVSMLGRGPKAGAKRAKGK